jgi:hypothetical protein
MSELVTVRRKNSEYVATDESGNSLGVGRKLSINGRYTELPEGGEMTLDVIGEVSVIRAGKKPTLFIP